MPLSNSTEELTDSAASPPEARLGFGDILLTFIVGTLVGTLAALLLGATIETLGFSLSPTVEFAVLALVVYAGMAAAAWYFAVQRKKLDASALGLRPVAPGVLAAMIPLALAVFVADALIVALVSVFFPTARHAQADLFPAAGEFDLGDLAWLLVLMAVAAPVVEEILFRGLLYQHLRRHRSVAAAVVVSAALFAAAHVIPVLLPSLFGLGVVLALLVERYASIYPAIVLHALNNGIAVTLVYIASQTGGTR